MVKRKLRFWNIPVTEQLDDSLEKAVQVNAHVSKSDFVRDAVREKLKNMGIIIEQKEGAEAKTHQTLTQQAQSV